MAAAGEAKEKTRGWQVLHSTVGSELLQPSGSGRLFFFERSGRLCDASTEREDGTRARPAGVRRDELPRWAH